METVKCKALKAFTQFVPRFGLVHGDPDNKSRHAREPMVPVDFVPMLVRAGKITDPAADDGAPPAVAKPNTGKRGVRKAPKPQVTTPESPYTATYVPVGKYEINGPGLAEPIVVKGKAAAQAKLAELNAAHDAGANGDAGDAGDDGAPPVD